MTHNIYYMSHIVSYIESMVIFLKISAEMFLNTVGLIITFLAGSYCNRVGSISSETE